MGKPRRDICPADGELYHYWDDGTVRNQAYNYEHAWDSPTSYNTIGTMKPGATDAAMALKLLAVEFRSVWASAGNSQICFTAISPERITGD